MEFQRCCDAIVLIKKKSFFTLEILEAFDTNHLKDDQATLLSSPLHVICGGDPRMILLCDVEN